MSSEFWVGPHDDPDRVRLGPAVASGAEGVLYRGTLGSEDGPIGVAVKMLQPGHLERLSEWTTRWREQVELLGRAKVPGLVGVLGGFVGPLPHPPGTADPSTASLYLIMDWVEGVSLDRWAHTLEAPQPEQLLLVLVPVAAALDLLHSGAATGGVAVLHRDVKPANIVIRPGGDTVLVDLGGVRGLDDAIRRSGVAGTPGYVAPEVRSDRRWGPEADRYSLGAVAFYLLTGDEPPVEATTEELHQRLLAAAILDGRTELADHVLAMLDPLPDRRPASLANWVAQLRRSSMVALSGEVGLAPRAPGRHPASRQHRISVGSQRRWRRPQRWRTTVVALLLLGAGAILLSVPT
ncbi:MAG: protein kinase, partial [Actinomycetota bacterium]|nr:protein kinase [Actinomycetota bacterium]